MQPVNSELAVDRLSIVSFEAALATRTPAVSNFDHNMARKRSHCAAAVGTRTMKRTPVKKETKEFSAAVGRALRRAAKVARKTARMHGTPIYIWKDGKVVAEKP